MKSTISSISTVVPSVHFRGAIPENEDGILNIVQMRDVDDCSRIDSTQLGRVHFDPKYEKYMLRPGDILFLGRGTRNTASVVKEDILPAVAATYFIIIRITCNEILPEYLAVYLNLSETQTRVRAMARGTALAVIPMSELANLEIDIPPMETQRTIVELNRLLIKANEIENRIHQKRSLLIEATINRFFE